MKKSPFPGMDPFIESYKWSSFHVNAITQIQRQLVQRLPDGYIIEVEEGVNANDIILGNFSRYIPDASILESGYSNKIYPDSSQTQSATPPSVFVELDEVRQRTLTIRDVKSLELVTAIEVLSPSNKKGEGLLDYRYKRAEFIRNTVNFVEIDLLRGGEATYTHKEWPNSTYRIHAVNATERTISLWSVQLNEVLPSVSIPLLYTDRDIVLNLQEMFEEVYKYGSYPRTLRYDLSALKPKPTDMEASIVESIINSA